MKISMDWYNVSSLKIQERLSSKSKLKKTGLMEDIQKKAI
jgi:hypothetical protein